MSDGIPCKIGTIPMVIAQRDLRTPLAVGRETRIRERRGGKWQTVKVTRVDPDGYFMADRI